MSDLTEAADAANRIITPPKDDETNSFMRDAKLLAYQFREDHPANDSEPDAIQSADVSLRTDGREVIAIADTEDEAKAFYFALLNHRSAAAVVVAIKEPSHDRQ